MLWEHKEMPFAYLDFIIKQTMQPATLSRECDRKEGLWFHWFFFTVPSPGPDSITFPFFWKQPSCPEMKFPLKSLLGSVWFAVSVISACAIPCSWALRRCLDFIRMRSDEGLQRFSRFLFFNFWPGFEFPSISSHEILAWYVTMHPRINSI